MAYAQAQRWSKRSGLTTEIGTFFSMQKGKAYAEICDVPKWLADRAGCPMTLDWRYLSYVFVAKKLAGQGYGSRLLRSIEHYVDAHRFNLVLNIRPFAHARFKWTDLLVLYSKHGFFRVGDTRCMIRTYRPLGEPTP